MNGSGMTRAGLTIRATGHLPRGTGPVRGPEQSQNIMFDHVTNAVLTSLIICRFVHTAVIGPRCVTIACVSSPPPPVNNRDRPPPLPPALY